MFSKSIILGIKKKNEIVKRTITYLVILFVWFFLYFRRLGSTSLAPWDEAWYAEIARNILKKKSPFLLFWNGRPYMDHPFLGFWFIALGFIIFGVNEFGARFFSCLSALGSMFLLFFISYEFFKDRLLSLFPPLILATMPWFWLRARTANLDAFLVFFILLAIWVSIRCTKGKAPLWFLGVALALSTLIKTIVGFLTFPLCLYLLFPSFKRFKKRDWRLFFLAFAVISAFWYIPNLYVYGLGFIKRNIFTIGLRWHGNKGRVSRLDLDLAKTLHLLHMGTLLWYKPALIAFILGVLLIKRRFVRMIYLWIIIVVGVFSFSSQTELWHLIPVYPALATLIVLAIFGVTSRLKICWLSKALSFLVAFVVILFFGGRIVKGLYKDIVRPPSVSQEEVLSREVSKYSEDVFFDDDYLPVVVFYSGKRVYTLPFSSYSLEGIRELYRKAPFLLLTKEWLLTGVK